jgi:heptosyltransferase-2
MRILVMRGGAVGDFILTLPVFRALRVRYPDSRIEVLGYPAVAGLASQWVNSIRSLEDPGLTSFFVPNGAFPRDWTEYFRSFDIILSYLYDPQCILLDNIRRCCSARILAGPHRPDETGTVHACECLLAPLSAMDISNADPVPRIEDREFLPNDSNSLNAHSSIALGCAPPLTAHFGEADQSAKGGEARSVAPQPVLMDLAGLCELAIHPGSGSEHKNWPWPNWMELISRILTRTNCRLLLVGGEAEAGRWHGLRGYLDDSRCEVFFQQPLVQLAARLARSQFFLGHDSGITHLASAVGLGGLILWGPTNPTVWCPRTDRMHLLMHSGRLKQLPVDVVWKALTAEFLQLKLSKGLA